MRTGFVRACVRFAMAFTALLAGQAGAKILYVDRAGRCGGTSWQTAFTDLQTALDAAAAGDEIRVAQGVYTPPPAWSPAFRISKTLAVKGGYAGLAGPNPDLRDIDLHETVLSGDINGDDGPDYANTFDNCSSVVSIYGHISPTFDGLTITGGYGRTKLYSGGGIAADSDGLTLISCTFRNNRSREGGAVWCSSGMKVSMIRCIFEGNTAVERGGAVDASQAELSLVQCTFVSNRVNGMAPYNSRMGGAVSCASSHFSAVACRFCANAARIGGAVCTSKGRMGLRECVFIDNEAEQSGGAIAARAEECQIDGCSFVANSARTAGGAVSFYARGTVSNSILWGNRAPSGSQILLENQSSPTATAYIPSLSVSYCDIEEGLAGVAVIEPSDLLWAESNLDANPLFVRYPDSAGDDWGDVHLSPESPCRDGGDPNGNLFGRIDIDGEPRVAHNHVDIGADEYTSALVELASVEIDGPGDVQENGQARFSLRGTYADGRTVDLSELAAWSVQPLDYGHIDPNGLLRLEGIDTQANLQVNATYVTDQRRLEAARTIAYLPVHVTHHVDALSNPHPQDGLSRQTALATIQQAVELAEDGDTIWVYPGVYEGPLNFLGKRLTIQGKDGAATLDGKGYFGAICENGEGPGSTLNNMVVTNSSVGVFLAGSSPTIQHVTAADNQVGVGAYGGSTPTISHSIFWRNSKADLVQCEAIYSCVEDGDSEPVNIHADPLFADPARGDYHLKSQAGRWDPAAGAWVRDDVTSPCIDAGYLPSPWNQELWPHGKRVNIGAYGNTREASMSPRTVGHPADLNHNGIVDSPDLALFANRWREQSPLLAEDLDRDGDVDASDLEMLASSWLMPAAGETVAFRDYWPFAIGNSWWHTDVVFDAGLRWVIERCFEVGGFRVWQITNVYRGMSIRGGSTEPRPGYYVYINNGLYRTYDPCELSTLPHPPGELFAPEFVRINEPVELWNGKVWAIRGSLAEVLAQYRCPDEWSRPGKFADFQGGNQDDVLAFVRESSGGLYPTAIFGRGFGPMLYSYHLDGRLYAVSIVRPGKGDAITRAQIVTIEAELAEPNAAVTRIEFVDAHSRGVSGVDVQSIGQDANGRDGWSCPWPYPASGQHSLTAKAFNAAGQILHESAAVEIEVPWSSGPTMTITEPNGAPVAEDPPVISIRAGFSHPVIDGMWVQFVESVTAGTEVIIGEDRTATDGWVCEWMDHKARLDHTLCARMMFGQREIARSNLRFFRVQLGTQGRR